MANSVDPDETTGSALFTKVSVSVCRDERDYAMWSGPSLTGSLMALINCYSQGIFKDIDIFAAKTWVAFAILLFFS